MSGTVITPEFRASYPYLFKPQENKRIDGTTVLEYSVVGIFSPGADLSALKALAEAALVEELGPDRSKWPANIRSPFRKCSEKWKYEAGKQVIPAGYEHGDAVFITMKQKAEKGKPTVVDAGDNPLKKVQEILEPSQVYAGCYCRASVRAYYYDNKGNRGVGFGLSNVQKLRDGDPLGSGRVKAEDEFEAVASDMASQTAGSIFG